MLSPGRTTKVSPLLTCSIGTVFSLPSISKVAVFGERFIRLFSASVVLPFDFASRSLPTVISVKIIAADSKYRSCIYAIAPAKSPAACAEVIKNRLTVL